MRISDWSSDVCSSDLKAMDAAAKERDALSKRLENPAFVERAKPEAVVKAREDLAEKAAEAERLQAALLRLGSRARNWTDQHNQQIEEQMIKMADKAPFIVGMGGKGKSTSSSEVIRIGRETSRERASRYV